MLIVYTITQKYLDSPSLILCFKEFLSEEKLTQPMCGINQTGDLSENLNILHIHNCSHHIPLKIISF